MYRENAIFFGTKKEALQRDKTLWLASHRDYISGLIDLLENYNSNPR